MTTLPFHEALFICNIREIAAMLVANPSSVHDDPGSDPPIIWAAANNKAAAVELLIQHGANIEVADEDGRTPLLAAAGECPDAVGVLLRYGANVNALDDLGCSPLAKAIWMQRQPEGQQIATMLQKAGAKIDLMAATALGDPVKVRELIEHDPSEVERIRVPQLLLSTAISVLAYGTTASRVEIIQMLLSNGLKLDNAELLKVAADCETSGLIEYAGTIKNYVASKP